MSFIFIVACLVNLATCAKFIMNEVTNLYPSKRFPGVLWRTVM